MRMTNVVSKSSFSIEVLNQIYFPLLADFLSDVSILYPEFDSWLNFKVRRNINTNERKILIAHDGDKIVGVALLKNTQLEQKISTFYVSPTYRGLGIGTKLMSQSLELLDTNHTFITVSEERNSELSPLLKSTGFTLQQTVPDMYRKGYCELFYSIG